MSTQFTWQDIIKRIMVNLKHRNEQQRRLADYTLATDTLPGETIHET